jgi:hypothetical protein
MDLKDKQIYLRAYAGPFLAFGPLFFTMGVQGDFLNKIFYTISGTMIGMGLMTMYFLLITLENKTQKLQETIENMTK